MKITVKGNADQEFNVPDQSDLTAINSKLVDLETRLKKLETPVASPKFFSPTSFYNKKLTNEPIHANSANFITEFTANRRYAAPWIATNNFSVPVFYADASSPVMPVDVPSGNANYAELKAGIRIPVGVRAANGGDGHCAIWDKVSNTCYSFWQFKQLNGRWTSSSCGKIANASNSDGIEPRLSQWNSATATHLPLVGGLVMIDELKAGKIPHALALSIVFPSTKPVWPASTTDGSSIRPNAIPEGLRFRFPANIVIDPNWTALTKMLVEAVRDYGMVVRDFANAGGVFYIEDDGTGEASIKPYMGTKAIWDIVGTKTNDTEFPWMQLQALA